MKNKRISILIICAVFVVTLVCSAVSLFSVKEVRAEFSVARRGEDSEKTYQALQNFKGVNLLFFNTDEIKKAVEENPYMQVTEIKKSYPNAIDVKIVERREIYLLSVDGKFYVADERGVVLKRISENEASSYGNVIRLSTDKLNINAPVLGSRLSSDSDETLYGAFALTEKVKLTDCIKNMKIVRYFDGEWHYDVRFETYSGVTVVIKKAETRGEEKIVSAFTSYDEEKNDYIKSRDYIMAYEEELHDKLIILWTDRDGGV